MQEQEKKHERQGGFTLIELLIAIVVVGVLTAVAIVGIGGLVDNGHTAACQATADAAKAASAVYYANSQNPGPATFPADYDVLQAPNKTLDVPAGVTEPDSTHLKGKGWTLAMTPGTATVAPVFTCGP